MSRRRWTLAAAVSAGALLVLDVALWTPVGFQLFLAITLPAVLGAWVLRKKLERWLPWDDDDEWPLHW